MTLKQRCTSPPPPTRRQGAGAAAIRGVGGPTARSTCRLSLAELERRLRQHGLEINPTKTAIIHSCRGRHLYHRGEGGSMQAVRGSHHGPGVAHHIWGASSCHSYRDEPQRATSIPQARTPPVRPHSPGGKNPPAPNTGTGGGHVGSRVLAKYGSHVQGGQQHADGTGPQNDAPRAPTGGELGGLERTHAARSKTGHPQSLPRWSTYTLERMWDMYGHMARAEQGGRPMLSWKNLQWWRREQSKPRSQRHTHAGQFNPIVDPERQLTKVAGDAWQEVARNTTVWGALRGEFLQQFDVPWSTGKQSSLENLVPNLTTTSGRSSTMRMIQTR